MSSYVFCNICRMIESKNGTDFEKYLRLQKNKLWLGDIV